MIFTDSKESVKLALDTLRTNKLRSGLTILGISIGISTVILISSAINGLNTNINDFINSLGTNNLWVYRYVPFGKRPTTEELNRKQLTYDDAMAMRRLPHVVAVDPELTDENFRLNVGNVSLKHGHYSVFNSILSGGTTAVMKTNNVTLLEGRIWTEAEEERDAKVVVLGHDSAEDLFPHEDPIGQDIQCGGDVFTVIGVLDKQPQAFGNGRNTRDNSAYFPLGTFQHLHPELQDYWIAVAYDNQSNKDLVTEEIRELLRIRREIRVQ